jgi:hypothetical protein
MFFRFPKSIKHPNRKRLNEIFVNDDNIIRRERSFKKEEYKYKPKKYEQRLKYVARESQSEKRNNPNNARLDIKPGKFYVKYFCITHFNSY